MNSCPRPPSRGRKSTALALIKAGEQLFAKHGIEGASLREIAAAAGSANSFAVQYHFGGRERLAEAILEHRQMALDARGAELLERAGDSRAPDVGAILEAMCRPLFEQRDGEDQHSYANFLASLRRSPAGLTARGENHLFRTTLVNRLRQAAPQLSDDEFRRRFTLGFGMLLDAIQWHDRGLPGFQDAETVLRETLRFLRVFFEAPADTSRIAGEDNT